MSETSRISTPPRAGLLDGRVVLVTGAGDGIGRVAAMTFAQHDASLVLVGRTRSKLESVNDEIKRIGSTNPLIVPVDLANLDEARSIELVNGIRNIFGRLDGLLHNASVLGPKTPLENYPYSQWRHVFQVNVHSQFLMTQALLSSSLHQASVAKGERTGELIQHPNLQPRH